MKTPVLTKGPLSELKTSPIYPAHKKFVIILLIVTIWHVINFGSESDQPPLRLLMELKGMIGHFGGAEHYCGCGAPKVMTSQMVTMCRSVRRS
jgi:hypothetical protein